MHEEVDLCTKEKDSTLYKKNLKKKNKAGKNSPGTSSQHRIRGCYFTGKVFI